jgi:hypothetical protein
MKRAGSERPAAMGVAEVEAIGARNDVADELAAEKGIAGWVNNNDYKQ